MFQNETASRFYIPYRNLFEGILPSNMFRFGYTNITMGWGIEGRGIFNTKYCTSLCAARALGLAIMVAMQADCVPRNLRNRLMISYSVEHMR